MNPNIEKLKANRATIINELNKVFKFEDMDIKDLMVAYFDYTSKKEYTMQQLITLCSSMLYEWRDGDIVIPQNGNSNLAMAQHEEKIRTRNYNTARLHN